MKIIKIIKNKNKPRMSELKVEFPKTNSIITGEIDEKVERGSSAIDFKLSLDTAMECATKDRKRKKK
jgi:hypothetical protein